MHNVSIKYKQLSNLAILPNYKSAQAAGMDLYAAINANISVQPNKIVMVPLGFAMALPQGFEAQIRPRSGLASKFGITLPNAPGTIDSDYRGEVCVPIINHGNDIFNIEPQMRIAQMIISPVIHATFELTDALDATQRGEGGFGSTGA